MTTLIYIQESGAFINGGSPSLEIVHQGAYAGAGRHKNNPTSQCISDLGPIPAGLYRMEQIRDEGTLKQAIRLTPDSDNDMCGRSGFLIHGESEKFPGWASAGCIIVADPKVRKSLSERFDTLKVVARIERGLLPTPARAFGARDEVLAEPAPSPRVPRFLGRGYSPHLSEVHQLMVDDASRNAIDPAGLEGERASVDFGLIATDEHFESALSIDAEVKARYGGFGARASASLRENVARDLRHVTFAVAIQVTRGSLYLDRIVPSDSARNALADPPGFLRVYGTDVIDSVMLGGSCVFFFTFEFASASEAKSFAGSVGLTYGANSGSVSQSLRTLLSKRTNNLKVSGYVTGTTELPDFFATALDRDADGSRGIFTSPFSEAVLAGILRYVDGFADRIKQAPVQALSQVSFEAVPLEKTELSLNAEAFEHVAPAIARARKIGALLNEQQKHARETAHSLSVMSELYPQYNSTKNLARAATMLERLQQILERIVQRKTALSGADFTSPADFSAEFPAIPRSFCTADPTHHEWSFLVPINGQIYWYECPVFDTDATHTISAEAQFYHVGHRTGSGTGTIALLTDDRQSGNITPSRPPALVSGTRESFNPSSEEHVFERVKELRVGRREGGVHLPVGPWSFVPTDDGSAKVLIRFAEDIQGHTLVIRVAVGRQ